MARFNMVTATVAELEAEVAKVAVGIAEARAKIAAGGLDERNVRNFQRYIARAQEWRNTAAWRIVQLNANARFWAEQGA